MPSSPPETKASLILRLPNAADVAAWDEFVAVYGPVVFRVARRQGLQPADAEDLVQEVFAAVAKQVGPWLQRPDRGGFRPWLLTIARNRAINLLTRRPHGGTGVGGDSESGLEDIPAKSASLSSELQSEFHQQVFRWAAEKVRQAVTDTTWLAFYRTHIDGLPIPAAAAELGISVGTVYIARSRVISRLKELAQSFEVEE